MLNVSIMRYKVIRCIGALILLVCIVSFGLLLISFTSLPKSLMDSPETVEYNKLNYFTPHKSNQKSLPQVYKHVVHTTSLKTITKSNFCSILIWTEIQGPIDKNWPLEGIKLPGNCQITYLHSYIERADIVVMHHNHTKGLFPWMFYRNKKQIFVWWSNLNPWLVWHMPEPSLSSLNGFFNWTMTYRRDSDVYFPFWTKSSLYESIVGGKDMVDKLIAFKSKSVVWIENDCHSSPSNRERMKYVVQLVRNRMDIDLVGSCFKQNSFGFLFDLALCQ